MSLLQADALRIPLADASVSCCVTSPPYWGLRDYGTATWSGGDTACDHIIPLGDGGTKQSDGYETPFRTGTQYTHQKIYRTTCAHADAPTVPAIVLDPFAGSGTTGAVARLHGRRFVGLDINGRYLRELALPRAEGTQTAASMATLPLFGGSLEA